MVDLVGYLPEGTKIESIVLAGSELKFTCLAKDNGGDAVIRIVLKIDGDKMAGRWLDEAAGTGGTVEVKRKKRP